MENLSEKELSKKTRPELEEYAGTLGLTSAATYQNKPAVLDAIARVKGGEDAATVDAELRVDNTPEGEGENGSENAPTDPKITDEPGDDDEAEDDEEESPAAHEAPKKQRRLAKNRNQGHPTAFDETGRPLYRA